MVFIVHHDSEQRVHHTLSGWQLEVGTGGGGGAILNRTKLCHVDLLSISTVKVGLFKSLYVKWESGKGGGGEGREEWSGGGVRGGREGEGRT